MTDEDTMKELRARLRFILAGDELIICDELNIDRIFKKKPDAIELGPYQGYCDDCLLTECGHRRKVKRCKLKETEESRREETIREIRDSIRELDKDINEMRASIRFARKHPSYTKEWFDEVERRISNDEKEKADLKAKLKLF